MSQSVKIPDPLYETAVQVKEDKDFGSIGDALRYMVREGGWDV